MMLLALTVLLVRELNSRRPPAQRAPQRRPSEHRRTQACVHPQLQLWHPSVLKYLPSKTQALTCEQEPPNWVSVVNGSLDISAEAQRKHGDIVCNYTPIHRQNDFSSVKGSVRKNVQTGFPIDSDFFEMKCVAKDGSVYTNVHAAIVRQPVRGGRPATGTHRDSTPGGSNPEGRGASASDSGHQRRPLNIVMFGYDSTSRMSWLRHLPKSHDYFVNVLGGVVMEAYNIVGDGTPAALLPILTGKNETELPEARRGKKGAKPVDGHPWIWTRLQQAGYATQYGEDMGYVGTFHYRMLGFQKQPVDHYLRPYNLYIDRNYKSRRPDCMGSISKHKNLQNWVQEFLSIYRNRPRFSFVFHSEYTHQGVRLKLADDETLAFLQKLKADGHLDNTLLIMMADHGARFSNVRQSVQGKQEERMPYMALRLPTQFTDQFPAALRNLKTNAHRLTTPFDIHETFLDVFNYDSANLVGDVKQRGISLLKEIPLERTCADAGVEMHWCACLTWKSVKLDDSRVNASANALLKVINNMNIGQRGVCAKLAIGSLRSAQIYAPNTNMMRFKQSADVDGYVADLSDTMKVREVHYLITLDTLPGHAIYEATVKFNAITATYSLNAHEISRTNRYGHDADCIATRLPHLRPYCYCNNSSQTGSS